MTDNESCLTHTHTHTHTRGFASLLKAAYLKCRCMRYLSRTWNDVCDISAL